MKALFVHDHGIHPAHKAWAESVDADFIVANPGGISGLRVHVYAKHAIDLLDKDLRKLSKKCKKTALNCTDIYRMYELYFHNLQKLFIFWMVFK